LTLLSRCLRETMVLRIFMMVLRSEASTNWNAGVDVALAGGEDGESGVDLDGDGCGGVGTRVVDGGRSSSGSDNEEVGAADVRVLVTCSATGSSGCWR
jgi:hypothetical protein